MGLKFSFENNIGAVVKNTQFGSWCSVVTDIIATFVVTMDKANKIYLILL